MDAIRRAIVILGASALIAMTAAGAVLARTPDWKLGAIKRPSSTLAAIAVRGGTFQIESTSQLQNASLQLTTPINYSVTLTIESQNYNAGAGIWTATARVPADAPSELYNLSINSGADIAVRAVKVLTAFPAQWYFVHLTDTHFGYSGSEANFTAEMRDFDVINPEFVVLTGDQITCGGDYPASYCVEDERYSHVIPVWEAAGRVPTIAVAGNHDMAHVVCCATCWLSALCSKGKYQDRYREYIGPLYYSFDFGQYHFVGTDLSGYPGCCPGDTLDDEAAQAQWIRDDLASAPGSIMRIMYAHQYHEGDAALEGILRDRQVALYLYGHDHADMDHAVGTTRMLRTAAGKDKRYRLIRINGSAIESTGYAGQSETSIPGGDMVTAVYSPANDGTQNSVTAAVTNRLAESFERGLLRFVLPKAQTGQVYVVTGGTHSQTIESGGKALLHVSVNIPANSAFNVTAKLYWPPAAPASVAAADTPADNGGSITVTWPLSADDGAGRNIVTGYQILRTTTPGTGYALRGTVAKGISTYEDTGTGDGVNYYYVARAADADSQADSAESGPAQSGDNLAPAKVSQFTAVGGSLKVTLTWRDPADADLAGTLVVRKQGDFPANPTDGTVVFSGTADSHVDANLEAAQTYYYTAFAYDRAPNYSDADDGSRGSATTDDAPPSNQPPTVQLTEPVAVKWVSGDIVITAAATDPDGAVSRVAFLYSQDSTNGADGNWQLILEDDTPPFSVSWPSRPENGTDGAVWVRAQSADDMGATSPYDAQRIMVDNEPPVFDGAAAAADTGAGGEILLSWMPPARDVSLPITYSVYITTTPGAFNFAVPALTGITTTTTVVTNLTDGVVYYFVVRATDSFNKEDGNIISVSATPSKTDLVPPAPPALFYALPGDRRVSLSWTNPTDSDFAGVKLVRNTEHYPTSLNDGILTDQDKGTKYMDSGLANGTTYYYTLFACDAVPNCSYAYTFAMPDSAALNLNPGWNSIALSVSPYNGAPSNVFSGLQINEVCMFKDSGILRDEDPGFGDMIPGNAYWVYSGQDASSITIEGIPVSGFQYEIPLKAGWNGFGNPFDAAVPWHDSFIFIKDEAGASKTLSTATDLVKPTIYFYHPPIETFLPLTPGSNLSIMPWMGYWIKALQPCTLVIKKP